MQTLFVMIKQKSVNTFTINYIRSYVLLIIRLVRCDKTKEFEKEYNNIIYFDLKILEYFNYCKFKINIKF